MKYLLILLLTGCASTQLYTDIGLGYISEVTVSSSTTISTPYGDSTIDSTFDLPINKGFLLLRGGIKIESWHLEFESITNADRHFDTARIYYRHYF